MIQLFESSSSRERLTAAGTFVRSFPPASEVLIVGATRPAVDDFVRGLSVRRLAGRGATFGLHRFSFIQLVARLATAELARSGQTPATSLGVEAVAARATFEGVRRGELSRLEKAAEFPGFARALASTVGELRLAGLDSTATANGNGSHDPRDLALLHRLFEEELGKASIADRPTMLRLAIRGLDELRELRKAPIVLLDVEIGSALEREFLAQLLGGSDTVFATVPAGDDETVTSLEAIGAFERVARDSKSRRVTSLSRLQSFLFSDEKPPQREIDESVRFFSAPGEARECVEIARQIIRAARNEIAFDEVAVFLRAPELYSAHLETAFRRARIPAYFARGTKRPDPAGRAFLALLACKTEGLSAKRFAEYLSFSQVPDLESDGAPPPGRETWVGSDDESFGAAAATVQLSLFAPETEPTSPPAGAGESDDGPQVAGTLRAPWKWEEYLVEAAVIGGRDRWRRRLVGLENELKMKLERLAAEEPESPRIPALERELTNLGHLERFALPVIDALDDFPEGATWGEWLRILTELAPRVLRQPDRVLGVLAEMHPMSAVGPLSIEEVSAVLAERLSTLEKEQPAHRFGRVYVATPDAARGRSFRVVFVPGLAERVFPRRPREDPLLLDTRRISLSDGLRTQIDRGHQERMLLLLAVGAAENRVVLSYPRADVVEARPRVPSFYGLDVARATRGLLPDHAELEREADSVTNARLAWPAPPEPDDSIDAVEHDLSTLRGLLDESKPSNVKGRARYLLELNDHLARSLRSRWIRWRAKDWAPEDGLVRTTEQTAPALASQRPHERPYSVTALQRYAACPYQFLLAAIHRLEPRREAAALVQLDPLTRGSMVHEIQARTLRALKEANALPVRPATLADATVVLDEILNAVESQYREDLAPAILRVWQDEVGAIRGDLRVWLKMMSDDDEWVPEHFEFAFGLRDRFDAADSIPDPVTLPGGWKLRGAVDLIERRPSDGHLRVTDHKTGAHPPSEGTIVGGGEILQPALYSLAVEKALPGTVDLARLFFCTSRGRFTEVNIPVHDFARHYAQQVMEIIDRAIEAGALPPAPRRNACAWCDFRPVCGPSEETRAGRKAPELVEDLKALRGLP